MLSLCHLKLDSEYENTEQSTIFWLLKITMSNNLRHDSFADVHDGSFRVFCDDFETINNIFDRFIDNLPLLWNDNFNSLFNLLLKIEEKNP